MLFALAFEGYHIAGYRDIQVLGFYSRYHSLDDDMGRGLVDIHGELATRFLLNLLNAFGGFTGDIFKFIFFVGADASRQAFKERSSFFSHRYNVVAYPYRIQPFSQNNARSYEHSQST